MAEQRKRPRTNTYGSLAYNLDTLARERELEEAAKVREQEQRPNPGPSFAVRRRPNPAPRRRPCWWAAS